MRTPPTLLVVAVLYLQTCAACETVATYAQAQALPTPKASVYGFQYEQISACVYALNQGDEFHLQPRGNVGIIEQSQGVVLIDSGGSPDAAEQAIALLHSLTNKPVMAIVITHWHGDHALGVSRLLEEWPQARVISTQPTREMLDSPEADHFMPGDNAEANAVYMANIEGGVTYLRDASRNEALDEVERAGFAQAALEYEQFGREMLRARRMPPTEVFEQSLTLDDPTHPVEVRFPGRANTAGDAIVWLPRQQIVFTGDVVVLPIPYGFNVYPEEWIGVLQDIRDLGYQVLVPGHGRPMRDTVYIEKLISMLVDVRKQVAPLAKTEMDTTAVSAAVSLEAASYLNDDGDPWMRRWFRDYWKEPIVSSTLREARGEAIIQGTN